MHYTLDSEKHVLAVLERRYDGQKFISEPFETTNLNDLVEKEDIFYFGIITLGANVTKAILFDGDKEIIEIVKNSQIIEYFTKVKYYDDMDVEILTDVKGRFRGYEMTLE